MSVKAAGGAALMHTYDANDKLHEPSHGRGHRFESCIAHRDIS
jgi:hypothetical protein